MIQSIILYLQSYFHTLVESYRETPLTDKILLILFIFFLIFLGPWLDSLE